MCIDSKTVSRRVPYEFILHYSQSYPHDFLKPSDILGLKKSKRHSNLSIATFEETECRAKNSVNVAVGQK